MLVIVVGMSGVGGLAFAPWLLLLIPFGTVRIALRKIAKGGAPVYFRRTLWAANLVIELAMVGAFVYLYNLVILSYCGLQKV
jgi:hypothetical protein